MHFCAWQIAEVGFSPLAREENVVLPPKDYRFGLSVTQKLLPLRVELDIRSVIIEKVHLNAARIGSLHEAEVHVPVVGTDKVRVLVAMEIYSLDRVKLKQAGHTLFALWSAFFPEYVAQPCPCFREADFVGVGVLNDEPLQHIRIACHDSEAYRASVILHEETITIESLLLQESRRDFSEPVERVGKIRRIRHVAVAESGIIWCDDVKAVGERWYQIPILM